MKYRDLIQFEAVTEVVQLVSANKKENAEQLVKTYVISDRMADVIQHRILPALQMGDKSRSRGLLIVGNYGTGKSHLMSVLTSIAEHADLLNQVKHESLKNEFSSIAGKFKVSRQETTALNIPLRDVVFSQLQKNLKQMGVEYQFPGNQEAVTNKQALMDMMEQFTSKYPQQGLMIALDELLDFLRQKNEQAMIMDLNFLREVGEICEILPLRFIAGIQEALFDNPRFQFVASSIQRVKSRFDEASIVREDIEYVVSHRLLSKTGEQKKVIRKHLESFTKLYAEMAERLDDFVELFPVHPSYLEAFERVTIGERRELLKAISHEMASLLEKDLPKDQPGLITFDSYWLMIREDNAFRAITDVRKVWEKADILIEKVRRSPDTSEYQEAALRIIDGLSLHRLTVSDINTPIGITPIELRDQLCIYLPLPEQDADFLLATIETILKAIMKAVSGQFISHNSENDQYYLDLKKDIDYEALIASKAETLDPSTLDRYYFDVISHAIEVNTQTTYVPGFRIWESEIPWAGHGITRRGYIFLGAANERSTAHPERDYYIHFLAIFGNGLKELARKKDEVYFKLVAGEKDLTDLLRGYAGAAEMSAISSGSNKDQYELKAQESRRKLLRWLWDNFLRSFKVIHLDQELTITEAISKYHIAMREQTFRDQVYRVSGSILNEEFSNRFPDYPCFSGIELNSQTLYNAADSTVKAIGGGPNYKLPQVLLEGLELGHLDAGQWVWTIESSRYASYFQNLINSLEVGKVINHQDLVAGEPGAERDVHFQLEPELLVVVLAALMRQGGITINVLGMQIAESDLNSGGRIGLEQLLKFTSISRPKPIPEQSVKELFSQFNVPTELVGDPAALAIGVSQLQQNVQNEIDKIVRMLDNLREGPKFWQEMILAPEDQQKARKTLEDYRQFLSSLQPFSLPARLANLNISISEIREAVKARLVYEDIQHIFTILEDLDPSWEYLIQSQPLLPAKDDWQSELKDARKYILKTLADPEKRQAKDVSSQLKARLENVQASYTKRYLELHNQYRLDRGQDSQKQSLISDPRWARMRALGKLSLLPTQHLERLQGELGKVETCYLLQPTELRTLTHCPHCGFDGSTAVEFQTTSVKRLEQVKAEFELLCKTWIETLLSNLNTEEARQNMELINQAERDAVQEFLRTRSLPEHISERFIDGIENTLHGLEIIEVDGADYLLALTQPGMPCTVDELEKRIREFLVARLENKDRKKIRIQINW